MSTKVDCPLALHLVDTEYKLYAVVVHSGSSPHHGHYYAYCRDSSSAEGRWRKFDDESVEDCDEKEPLEHRINRSPYLLFYARDDDDEDLSGEWSADLRGFVDRDNEAALNETAAGDDAAPLDERPGVRARQSAAPAAAWRAAEPSRRRRRGGGFGFSAVGDAVSIDCECIYSPMTMPGASAGSSSTRAREVQRDAPRWFLGLDLRRVVVARPRDFCRGRVHGADRHGVPRRLRRELVQIPQPHGDATFAKTACALIIDASSPFSARAVARLKAVSSRPSAARRLPSRHASDSSRMSVLAGRVRRREGWVLDLLDGRPRRRRRRHVLVIRWLGEAGPLPGSAVELTSSLCPTGQTLEGCRGTHPVLGHLLCMGAGGTRRGTTAVSHRRRTNLGPRQHRPQTGPGVMIHQRTGSTAQWDAN